MDERILKWLYDIKLAVAEIDLYFEGKKMNFFEYKEDIMLKRAVERDLEIIGEAMKRILAKDKTYENKITDAKSIIGLRNQVIHAYDSISDENIWAIIIKHLPKLKKEIGKLIKENE